MGSLLITTYLSIYSLWWLTPSGRSLKGMGVAEDPPPLPIKTIPLCLLKLPPQQVPFVNVLALPIPPSSKWSTFPICTISLIQIHFFHKLLIFLPHTEIKLSLGVPFHPLLPFSWRPQPYSSQHTSQADSIKLIHCSLEFPHTLQVLQCPLLHWFSSYNHP